MMPPTIAGAIDSGPAIAPHAAPAAIEQTMPTSNRAMSIEAVKSAVGSASA